MRRLQDRHFLTHLMALTTYITYSSIHMIYYINYAGSIKTLSHVMRNFLCVAHFNLSSFVILFIPIYIEKSLKAIFTSGSFHFELDRGYARG